MTQKTLEAIDARLADAGIARRHTDHGHARSWYALSPDDLTLEFTVDADEAHSDAHAELERWLNGEHTPNNVRGTDEGSIE